MKKSSSHGFSLVELLVVIAIISMLASLLMPALRNSIGMARSLSCLNNLRQVGMRFFDYGNENKGWVPSYYCHSEMAFLLGYDINVSDFDMISEGIFPNSIRGITLCPETEPLEVDYYKGGYAMTGGIISDKGGCWYWSASGYFPRKQDQIASGSVIMIEPYLSTTDWGAGPFAYVNDPGCYLPTNTNNWATMDNSRITNYEHHNGAANFLKSDGSVSSHMAGQQFNDNWQLK